MATRTNSLVTAATLASAAAIAVATPAIVPSLNLPSPHALTAAKVQLATFADVLSVPAAEWTDLLFQNTSWGGVLSSDNYGAESAKPQDAFLQPGYVNPWAVYCDGGCDRTSFTGVAYLFFDALINGNGLGYDNVDQWDTGIVNYFWEPNATFVIGGGSSPGLQYVSAGWSAATWYAIQTTLGAAFPQLTIPIAAPFWGPDNISVAYNAILTGVAQVISLVPGVGPLAGNSILAYLGNLEIPGTPGLYYQYGLSGTLNYLIDIATGAVPFPSASTRGAAALAAAATPATPAVAAATVTAPEATPAVDAKAPESTPADDAPESTPAADAKAPESTPAADASESTPAEAPESTPAAETPAAETPAAETPAAETPAAETPAADVSESTPEVTDTEPVSVPEAPAADATDSTPAPAKAAPKRPVRDAVEKVTKQINSAIDNAKAAKANKGAKAGS